MAAGPASLAGCAPRVATTPPPRTITIPLDVTATPPAAATVTPSASATAPATAEATTFAVIGDFGVGGPNEQAVATMVASWRPAYVITTGDNHYARAGGTGTGQFEDSVGAYYCAWLKDITTTDSRCREGSATLNAFFPSLGNHDYDASGKPASYLTYFSLPGAGFVNTSGNERYYDFVEGPIHWFVLNSNPQEPDGTSPTSVQARWLKSQLATSTSTWNIVVDHHPPYSSDNHHGSTAYMQWPFAAWGADAVLSGHAHTYERVMHDGIPYFVDGMGGGTRYGFTTPVDGSTVRYAALWGAQKATVTSTSLDFEFYTVDGSLVDSFTVPARRPTGQ